jgi:cellulose synthase/poly-beta-1,6-N-acetylglucosamine synthase-like glycosyltransferase
MVAAEWIFVSATAAVLYILAGWPALLAVLSRYSARPGVRDGSYLPGVSAVIAVHNGGRFLRAKLDSVFGQDYPQERLQVIVASDGSTDETEEIAQADPRVTLVRVPRGGKCRALNAGAQAARNEILLLTDVRQVLQPDCLRQLVAHYADPSTGVVSGELRIRAGDSTGSENVGLYWRIETWIRNRLSDVDSMFGATGPIYSMRRDLFVPVPEEILLDDMYLPLNAFFRGYRLRMEEKAIATDVPTSVATEFQRKVRTLAGNYQLLAYFPKLLVPFANRMWLHYVSYKLGRLMLPWLFGAMLVSSWFLPAPWNLVALAPQLGVYALAAVDPLVREGTAVKRLSSPAHVFLTMMAAAVVALRVLWTDPRDLWIVTSAKSRI